MMKRRALLASLVLAMAMILAHAAHAADKQRYTQEAFKAVLESGRPVLVEVSAPWCPICKAQKPILSQFTAERKFDDLVVFEVDFDSQKPALRALNVQKQSTLIVYKGGREVGRSTGDTNRASIESLLNKSL